MGELREFSYYPGYSDMRGAYHYSSLKKDENGKWVIISSDRKENGLPPLSGLVVNKENNCPGAGYFEAYYPNVKAQDRIIKYAEIMKQILDYPHWDEVLKAYKALA